MQVLDELGLIDDFLKVSHDKLQRLEVYFGKTRLRIADISRTSAKYPFIAFVPQWIPQFPARPGTWVPKPQTDDEHRGKGPCS